MGYSIRRKSIFLLLFSDSPILVYIDHIILMLLCQDFSKKDTILKEKVINLLFC